MNAYRTDYEERMANGYIHLAHIDLTAMTGKQALEQAVGILTDTGVHVTGLGPVHVTGLAVHPQARRG